MGIREEDAGADEGGYVDGARFHEKIRRVYDGELGWAVNKSGASMARVLYEAPHENVGETGVRRGKGKDWARWVFSEEAGIAEGIFTAPLELVIDARLEPGACIGLHVHRETEEMYYVLEGSVTMTTIGVDGMESSARLVAGDAHAVKVGQGHFGEAGEDGVRFIAVAVRVRR